MKHAISLKLGIIAVLCLLLLIPATMIQSLIKEREHTSKSAAREVSSKWGGEQTLVGPIISIPYKQSFRNGEGKLQSRKQYAHFLPEELQVNGTTSPQLLKRSIYKLVQYSSDLEFSGHFLRPDFSVWNIADEDILWDEASISMSIPDFKGIKSQLILQSGEQSLALNPTDGLASPHANSLSARLALNRAGQIPFSVKLKLNGSESLQFVPIGKTTRVHLTGSWPSPVFDGNFLPDSRQVSAAGFEAQWQVLHLNRNFPQQWINRDFQFKSSAFGVWFRQPVEHYFMSHRAAKYALMFIALSFVVFFFVEVIHKKRLHPIQYLLIGFSICLFYMLLLSLSEQIGFGWAYLLAATGTIGLITGYTRAVMGGVRIPALIAGLLIGLYSYLYGILQLEDYALLLGSIGLFVIMAFLMYFSRKVNWYQQIE
ncbi:MAG: cell envelope integrity protein CreD [Bacteroidia bacterium]